MPATLQIILPFLLLSILSGQASTLNARAKQEKLEAIGEAAGDLDKDGIPEKAVVYNTSRHSDSGYVRVLHIYKQKHGNWELWQKSESAILKSEEGGMMGDPFESLEIQNGILKIYHSGGSSWKWSEQHKYRFQNGDVYLIGVTSTNGKPCEYWASFDYNLLVGKAVYIKEFENCNEDGEQLTSRLEREEFTHQLKELPKLINFSPGAHKITSPKLHVELYY